jgi:hypothetical protein
MFITGLGWISSHRPQADDEVGAETVVLLIAIEKDLQGAEADDDQGQADHIDVQALRQKGLALVFQDLRFHHQPLDQEQGQHANREVDQKDPVPGEVVRQPAAQDRTDGGGADDRQAVERKGLGPLFRGKRVSEHGLLGRCHPASADALDDAGDQHHGQRGGHRAHQRRQGEQRDTAHVKALAAQHVGKPAADRQDDSVGDEVAGEDPGRFVLVRGEAASDMTQGNVGDGGVQDLHERGDGDDDGDQPGVAVSGGGAGQWCPLGCPLGGGRHRISAPGPRG